MNKKMLLVYVAVLALLVIFSGTVIAYWRRGTIEPGNVVKLQTHFPVHRMFYRTEGYQGKPCVAYKGGYFIAMERFQVPFFESREASLELFRVSYVPINSNALKENECTFGTSFRTPANTWFAWKEGLSLVELF